MPTTGSTLPNAGTARLPNATPPRSAGGASGSTAGKGGSTPPGARPPADPRVTLYLLRVVFVLCLLLTFVRAPVLAWATTTLAVAPVTPTWPTPPPAPTLSERGQRAVASFAQRVLLPPAGTALRLISLLGLIVLAGELVVAAGWLVQQTLVMRAAGRLYLRIRTPHAESDDFGAAESGTEILYALHQLLDGQGRHGRAGWLSLLLSGAPDEPVTLGAVVASGTRAQRAGWAAALRKVVSGHTPGAIVDEPPDPLQQALRPGAVAVWREFALSAPPSYPLRLRDETAADLLGPLIAALRPRPGTCATELQLTLRPRRDWHLSMASWRVHAMRRLLKLKARQVYGLQPDMIALQEKLDGPTYDATIRVVVVAADQAQMTAAHAELDELTAVLGQYTARSGNRAQRLMLIGGGTQVVPLPPSTLPLARALRRLVRFLTARRTLAQVRPRLVTRPAPVAGLLTAARRPPTLLDGSAAQRRTIPVGRLVSVVAGSMVGFLLFGMLGIGLRTLGGWVPAAWRLALPAWLSAELPTMLAGAGALLLAHLVLRTELARAGVLAETRLARLRARVPRPHAPQPVMLPCALWAGPSILSVSELGGLWHLPANRQEHLVRWLPCRVLPAPPHAFTGGNPERLVIGHARRSDGTLAPVGPTLRDLRQILHLTAGMGAGKSRLLANLVQQLFAYREDGARPNGLLVLDGKGDDDQGSLVAVVRRLLPLEAEARLVLLDPLDTAWPIGINPLQGIDLSRPGGADMALGQVLAIFGRLDPETWNKAMGMQQYVRMAALLVLEGEALPTLAHIKQALLDRSYRERLLPGCTNIDVTTFWQITFPQIGEMQRTSLDALLRRFDNLLTTETTRYLLTQPRSTMDFRRAMDEGLIVLMPMPDMTLGGMANLIGMLMFQAIVRAAFGRAGSDQTRLTCPLIADEFQVFIGTGDVADLRTALTRLRSLGIAGIYAHQSLIQLGELRDEMLINAASRVMLQTMEPDASIYAKQYAVSGLTAADIAGQDPHEHQYLTLRCAGQSTGVCSVVPLPWPEAEPPQVPPASSRAWQAILPPVVEPADEVLVALVYGFDTAVDHATRAAMVADLAQMPEAEWVYLCARWETIRAAQRAHLLAQPVCIPDQMERQRWLSRLWAATPRLLAAAQYQRQRWAIEPTAPTERGDGRRGRQGRGGEQGSTPGQREWRTRPDPRHKTSAHFGVDGGPPEEPGANQPSRPPRPVVDQSQPSAAAPVRHDPADTSGWGEEVSE